MAYELSDEQRLARQGVTFTAGEGFDFDGGHFLDNWRRSDKELEYAEIYVLVHGGFKFREIYRHRLQVVINLDEQERDGKVLPARNLLTSRQFTCMESLKWQKHLVMRKSLMSPPTCPIERLIEFVKADQAKYNDVPLFRFGNDCTMKDGKPEKVIELTGYDLWNKAANWRDDHNVLGKGQHIGVVIPLGGMKGRAKWDQAEDDIAPKIYAGSWGLFGKFQAEINRAIGQYGEDIADPRWAPAVYQIVFDQTPRGGKKPLPADQYSVHFVDPSAYKIPDKALEVGGNDLPVEFVEALEKLQTPATAREMYETMRAGLVADLDLAAIMGYDPDDEEAPLPAPPPAPPPRSIKEGALEPEPAAKKAAPKKKKPAAKSRRRVVDEVPTEPEAAEGDAEPCEKCGTPWPDGVHFCPGREANGCRCFDKDVPKPDADVGDLDELPFAE